MPQLFIVGISILNQTPLCGPTATPRGDQGNRRPRLTSQLFVVWSGVHSARLIRRGGARSSVADGSSVGSGNRIAGLCGAHNKHNAYFIKGGGWGRLANERDEQTETG